MKRIHGFQTICTSVRKPYISLEVLAFSKTCELLTIDLINTKLLDFGVYNVVLHPMWSC